MTGIPVASFDPHLSWRETAVRQGLLCLVCSEAPSLDHRAAFYDTGLCERCSGDPVSKDSAPPTP